MFRCFIKFINDTRKKTRVFGKHWKATTRCSKDSVSIESIFKYVNCCIRQTNPVTYFFLEIFLFIISWYMIYIFSCIVLILSFQIFRFKSCLHYFLHDPAIDCKPFSNIFTSWSNPVIHSFFSWERIYIHVINII